MWHRWLALTILAALTLQTSSDGGFRLPDQPPKEETESRSEGRAVSFGQGDNEEQGRSVSLLICVRHILCTGGLFAKVKLIQIGLNMTNDV